VSLLRVTPLMVNVLNGEKMSTQETRICDAATARDETLKLLATEAERRVLIVTRHAERPIRELVFCHRRCTANPTTDQSDMVQALSGGQEGVRSFSGQSCGGRGEYIGNNIWGRGFAKETTYCQACGYAMTGPQINHVVIVHSGNRLWDQEMIDQCEIGAYWHEGKNIGLTYEVVDH
jgi:hypothetical protein